MKGFKSTGKGPKMGHSFDSGFGFTGSSGTVRTVKPHMRAAPMMKAEGGKVDPRKPVDKESKDSSLLSRAKKGMMSRTEMIDKASGYAEGGEVSGSGRRTGDHSTIGREEASNQLDEETGGKTPLRPGFRRGGPMKRRLGGPVAAAKGGMKYRSGKC